MSSLELIKCTNNPDIVLDSESDVNCGIEVLSNKIKKISRVLEFRNKENFTTLIVQHSDDAGTFEYLPATVY